LGEIDQDDFQQFRRNIVMQMKDVLPSVVLPSCAKVYHNYNKVYSLRPVSFQEMASVILIIMTPAKKGRRTVKG